MSIEIAEYRLRCAGRDSESEWPYSIVKGHWPGPWQPTFLQPRCEVAVSTKLFLLN